MMRHHLDVVKAMKWIEQNKDKKFNWGVTDCCMTTCNFIRAMTTIDPASDHRGHYKTEVGAKRALIRYGSIEDTFDKHYERLTNLNLAKRGDAVLMELPNGKTLGFKWVGGVMCMTDNGIRLLDIDKSQIVAMWSVFNG